MGKGLQRVAAICGGLTVTAKGKTVHYDANGKAQSATANGGSLKRVVSPLAWKWAGHLSGKRCVTAYRCEQYKASAEKWCNRREGKGPMGYEYYGGGTSFFLDGDKREYKSEKQLIAAIEKRANNAISLPRADKPL